MSKCECKNCIHIGVCLFTKDKICKHFKDKSLFVELPCEWGKDVYTIVKGRKCIFKTKLFAIGVTEDGYTVYNPTYNPTEYPKGVFGINGVILGENTFSTKEEAEAKLKEIDDEEDK